MQRNRKNLQRGLTSVLICFFLITSAFSEECTLGTKKEPPFWVSGEYRQGEKVYENLWTLGDEKKRKRSEYIPRGSIVYTPPILFGKTDPKERVPIEVLSVPEVGLTDTLKKSLYYDPVAQRNYSKKEMVARIAGTEKRKRAEVGTQGFISHNSLDPVSEYTFLVKEDARVYRTPLGTELNGKHLSLKMDGDEFLVKNCCRLNLNVNLDGGICVTDYIMELKDETGGFLEEFAFHQNKCGFLNDILPVPNDDVASISKVLDLVSKSDLKSDDKLSLGVEDLQSIAAKNSWDGSTRTSVPRTAFIKYPIDPNTNFGPYNSFHYNKDDKLNSDVFIDPLAACAFTQVLKKFDSECKGTGCQVMFGDMYHLANWKSHATHGSGKCIDIRPFRKDDDIQNRGLTYDSPNYDRTRTESFIEVLVKAGGEKIYFNDKKIYKKYETKEHRDKVRPDIDGKWAKNRAPIRARNHDNHIHVCFPANADVKKTCKDGL